LRSFAYASNVSPGDETRGHSSSREAPVERDGGAGHRCRAQGFAEERDVGSLVGGDLGRELADDRIRELHGAPAGDVAASPCTRRQRVGQGHPACTQVELRFEVFQVEREVEDRTITDLGRFCAVHLVRSGARHHACERLPIRTGLAAAVDGVGEEVCIGHVSLFFRSMNEDRPLVSPAAGGLSSASRDVAWILQHLGCTESDRHP
jgi:hypothetical protein